MNLREFFVSNRWWGKLFGAFLGYLIGGSAGAFFGLLIGNFVDRLMLEYYNRPYWYYRAEKRQAIQRIFFEATFSVIGHIAKADGRISQEEINMAMALMNDMGLNHKQKRAAKRFFNQGKAANFDLRAILDSLQEVCHDNPELLKLFMDIQYRAAQTDGLSEKKIQVLDLVFRRMGFAPLHEQYRFYADFGQYAEQQSQSGYYQQRDSSRRGEQRTEEVLVQAYAILELNPNANKQEIKRAYRRLISRNHPDKLIAQGLPEEMIKMANDKTQKITKAYERICTSRGW